MSQAPAIWRRVRAPLAIALTLIVALALLRWSGLPQANRSLFYAGALSLLGMLGGSAALAWYLLVKPLPPGQAVPASRLGRGRLRVLAALLTVSGISIVVGGVWDEVWHRRYGLPFGEDLLWRPHLLIYLGLLLMALCGFWGLLQLWRGQGSLRQRFRANPPVGSLVLLGAFLVYALPADPLWHLVYGADISAWSLPHLVLMLCFGLIMIVAVGAQLSTLPARRWSGPGAVRAGDALVFVALAFALMMAVQLFTTEWDTVRAVREASAHVFWQRPAWLLPAIIAALAGFFGALALHATRLVGAAFTVGALALLCRALLLQAFAYEALSADAWLLCLPPLLALDLAYATRLRAGGGPPPWPLGGLAVALATGAGSLPLMQALFVYPRVTAPTAPMMLLMGLALALCGVWAGRGAGDALAAQAATRTETTAEPAGPRWVLPAALLVTAGFIVIFIATARPPV